MSSFINLSAFGDQFTITEEAIEDDGFPVFSEGQLRQFMVDINNAIQRSTIMPISSDESCMIKKAHEDLSKLIKVEIDMGNGKTRQRYMKKCDYDEAKRSR